MCGIVGFWGRPDPALLRRMTAVIRHRGPDGEGFFEDEAVSLGHRRLSIIDIEGGRQPMANEDGTIQLVYNGEVYNFRELRAELAAAGHRFRTDSDSEVVLHAYEEYGTGCFERFNGMWSLALADLPRRRLILARDHFGIKPLYYASTARRLLFASEIKAILQDPEFRTSPCDQIIYEYLAYGLHDHRDETFFEGVLRLPAASYAVVDDGGMSVRAYWTPRLTTDGNADPAEFRRLFREAVRRRLVADVPLGACLSGGLDSTSIVRVMNELLEAQDRDAGSMGARLQTFSAVFDGDPIDERDYIEEAVQGTRAEPNYIHPTPHEFVTELESFVWHQEEPTVSTGPYAQWRVMRGASEKVKVLLDGQGGDELLAGYVPYHAVYLRQLLRERRFGLWLREAWAAKDVLWPLVRRRLLERSPRRRIDEPGLIRDEFRASVAEPRDLRPQADLKDRLLRDLTLYSLPCLLRYEDKNSMAFSMESRVPFLDQELVEHILSLPPEAIISSGWSRAVFRKAMSGIIPEKIRRRRWKVGFTTPEIRWLMNRRAVFGSLIASPAFQGRKYWNGEKVLRAFRGACAGRLDNSMFFWRAINVELWLRVFFDDRGEISREAPESFTEAGDRAWAHAAAAAGRPEAGQILTVVRPNPGKHLFTVARGRAYARLPLRTRLVDRGDDPAEVILQALDEARAGTGGGENGPVLRDGDIVAVSEKVVAISQGRSFTLGEVRVSLPARVLSRFVNRNPHGIGVGRPETMQLAIREVGLVRILVAAAVGALGKLIGVRGLFYDIAGPRVKAIDGPTAGTIPPYNTHAKLAPEDPDGVAAGLAAALRRSAGVDVAVVVVDANDLDATVLGSTPGVDRELIAELFADNPLGQGLQQTPVAVLRDCGPTR
ncbi:MAG: asparagine synthase (glutamine-hydrolyzing) [Bacillota bacterium]